MKHETLTKKEIITLLSKFSLLEAKIQAMQNEILILQAEKNNEIESLFFSGGESGMPKSKEVSSKTETIALSLCGNDKYEKQICKLEKQISVFENANKKISKALSQLNKRQYSVVSGRYFSLPATKWRELAKDLSVSERTLFYEHEQALKKLSEILVLESREYGYLIK